MRRWVIVVSLLVATGSVRAGEFASGSFGKAKPKKTSRARPKKTAIKAPKGFKAVKLPKGLKKTPPADRWWEGADPCPADTTLDERTEHTWTMHACRDADGAIHGAYTEVKENDVDFVGSDGWMKHGVDHGVKRTFWDKGALSEQRTYVDGAQTGDALEGQNRGPYKDGERHGLWTLRADGGHELRGYFVKGKREGTWLAVSSSHGEEIVIARASYAKDELVSDAVWWTEDGTLLATITVDDWYKTRTVQFYGTGGKKTLTASCDEDLVVYLHQVVKGDEIECQYFAKLAADFGNTPGELAQQTTRSDTLSCPSSTSGYSALCTADVLDPYAVSYAMPRATSW